MKQQGMAGLAAVVQAAGLLLLGAQAGAQPRRHTAIERRADTRSSMIRQRTTQGVMLGAGRPSANMRDRFARRMEFRRARLARFRHDYSAPSGYYYSTPPVAYYYTSPSGYYYASPYRRRRHHRYRVRVAGYRGYYTASTPPGWHHGRKIGWRGRSVPPGHYR